MFQSMLPSPVARRFLNPSIVLVPRHVPDSAAGEQVKPAAIRGWIIEATGVLNGKRRFINAPKSYLLNPGLLRLRGIFGRELSVRR